MVKKPFNFRKLALESARIADDKKCKDIIVLNVRRLTTLCDYFVIATVESTPQMETVLSSIKKGMSEKGHYPLQRHGSVSLGTGLSSWQVIDYGGVVVHLMMPQSREFYALERMWYKAIKVNWLSPKPRHRRVKKRKK